MRIFFRGALLQADAASFKPLGGLFSADRSRVFWRSLIIDGADPNSFQAMGDFGRDARRVFYETQAIEGADPATFEIIGKTLSRDATRLFDHTTAYPIQPADVARFRMLAGWYATDDVLVYQLQHRRLKVISTEPARFKVLNAQYARSGEQIIHSGEALEDCDVAHARVLGEGWLFDGTSLFSGALRVKNDIDAATFRFLSPGFARDKERVFWVSQGRLVPIAKADADTFRVLDEHYSSDGKHVFHFSRHVEEADASSFQCLGYEFAKDANHVFHEGDVVEGDPESFRVLAHHEGVTFVADAKNVYREYRAFSDNTDWSEYRALPNADPKTFVAWSGKFSGDAKNVYWDVEPLQVDRAEFKALGDGAFTDGSRLWFGGELHGLVPSTFTPLGHGFAQIQAIDVGTLRSLGDGYAANDRLVYFHGEVVTGADAATFEPIGHGYARDANASYFYELALYDVELVPYGRTLPPGLRRIGTAHATDGQRVFWHEHELAGLDAQKTRVLSEVHATDGTRLYCEHALMADADLASFEVLHGHCARDKHQLFIRWSPITRPIGYASKEQRELLAKLCVASFRVLDEFFATDGQLIVHLPSLHVLEADASTFISLGDRFGRDAQCIYYGGYALRAADLHSFEVLGDGYARDASHAFYGDKALNTDGQLISLGFGCATDGQLVFQGNYPLADADPQTIEVLPAHGVIRDASHLWPLTPGWGHVEVQGPVEFLSGGYWRYQGALWWGGHEVIADQLTFEVLADGYARDATKSFYKANPL